MSDTRFPSSSSARRRRAPVRRRRTVLVVIVSAALAGIPAALAARSTFPASRPLADETGARLVIRDAGTTLGVLDVDRYESPQGGLDEPRVRGAVRAVVPRRRTVSQQRARLSYTLDRSAAVRGALRLGRGGGTIEARRRAISSVVAAPVVAQALRNNCESAALEILLATTGIKADQLRLQSQLPRSGPLDPRETAEGRVWGDPESGYVGRADGGGTAGGFGVYEGPVRRVAQGYGRRLEDLSVSPPSSIYARLRAGRAVMAWVGLSDGPYENWRSPSGRSVRVNFGEHTVVLVGITSGGAVRIVNPLEGTRETWSAARFEAMWRLLGRRALAAPG